MKRGDVVGFVLLVLLMCILLFPIILFCPGG